MWNSHYSLKHVLSSGGCTIAVVGGMMEGGSPAHTRGTGGISGCAETLQASLDACSLWQVKVESVHNGCVFQAAQF